MKRFKKLCALLITLAMMFSITACGGAGSDSASKEISSAPADSSTPEGDPIKVGFIGTCSGAEAYLGQTAQLALEDYIEEINAKGGVLGRPLKLVPYDIGLDPTAECVNATNRLIEQDKVCAIIGPESSTQASAAVDIVESAHVPMIVTTASNERLTVREDGTLNQYMFRMCFLDSYQGEALAHYAYDRLGLRHVAVLGDIANLYTQAIQNYFISEFEALGGEITSVEGFVDTDTDFRAPLANIKNSNAEAILVATGMYRMAGFIGQQCKELGMDQRILGVDGWYAQEIIDFAGKELDGSIMACMVDDEADEFTEYRKKFAEKHSGESVNYFAYYAVDALMAVQWAINETGSANPEDIARAMSTMKDVPVMTCDLTIDPETHNPINKPVYILEVTPEGFKTVEKYVPGK